MSIVKTPLWSKKLHNGILSSWRHWTQSLGMILLENCTSKLPILWIRRFLNATNAADKVPMYEMPLTSVLSDWRCVFCIGGSGIVILSRHPCSYNLQLTTYNKCADLQQVNKTLNSRLRLRESSMYYQLMLVSISNWNLMLFVPKPFRTSVTLIVLWWYIRSLVQCRKMLWLWHASAV